MSERSEWAYQRLIGDVHVHAERARDWHPFRVTPVVRRSAAA